MKPNIRFNGFEDEWVERKLGEVAEHAFGGGTPKTSIEEYWNGTIPWIQSSDVNSNHVLSVYPRKYVTESGVENSATKIIPANSIAIVTRVGVGKLVLISYDFATSQDFVSLSNLNIDPKYGVYAIYKLLQSEVHNLQGTSIKGITKSDLLGKRFFIATHFSEQQKIGALFEKLDDEIAAEQAKIDWLKEQKKGLLERVL